MATRTVGAAPLTGLVVGVALFGTGAATGPEASPDRTNASHLAGPPPAHTGGFGEPTCQTCHTDGGLNEPGGTLGVAGLADGYEPGRSYEVRVRLRSEGMEVAGFQAAFRFQRGSLTGATAGRLSSLDERTDVLADSATGIPYVRHTTAGTEVHDEQAVWRFQWEAPDQAQGPIALHVAANSGNGDNSPLGDLIYVASFELESW